MEPDEQSISQRVALVTGGSAGLGRVIAAKLLAHGYQVTIVGRDLQKLEQTRDSLAKQYQAKDAQQNVFSLPCDLTSGDDVARLLDDLSQRFGRLDALVNCVGTSDRGLIENLPAERLEQLLRQNVLTALLCCQASIPLLEKSGGTIVNIGSLASKVGARYIGGYAIAKHALAGMTQQLRLELKPRGIHVGLVSPGPIRRDDAGERYNQSLEESLPTQASAPGGGTRLRGLAPERVADAVLRCIESRKPDIVLPGYLRLLIATGHAFPSLGDWLLLKFTSVKED
jgi:NAD(P)-dependent dehydrogenase (short-subunit alcohol dehydrogenase family)